MTERITLSDGDNHDDTHAAMPDNMVALDDPTTLLLMQAFTLANFALSQASLMFHERGIAPNADFYAWTVDTMSTLNDVHQKSIQFALYLRNEKTRASMTMKNDGFNIVSEPDEGEAVVKHTELDEQPQLSLTGLQVQK